MSQPVEVLSDNRTVWVNDATGTSAGRFGPMGVDVHNTDVRAETECFYCTHGKPDLTEWLKFVDLMQKRHGVDVTSHKPAWLEPNNANPNARVCPRDAGSTRPL